VYFDVSIVVFFIGVHFPVEMIGNVNTHIGRPTVFNTVMISKRVPVFLPQAWFSIFVGVKVSDR